MSGESRRLVAQTCKSVCVSALIVLAAVLVFALFIRLFSISSAVIILPPSFLRDFSLMSQAIKECRILPRK